MTARDNFDIEKSGPPYYAVVDTLSEEALRRFHNSIDKSGNCWNWKGNISYQGYGRFSANRKYYSAHRISLEIALKKPLTKGLVCDHICKNKSCVNPDHLHQITQWENAFKTNSPVIKLAFKSKCIKGHENWGFRPKGTRYCLECRHAYQCRVLKKLRETVPAKDPLLSVFKSGSSHLSGRIKPSDIEKMSELYKKGVSIQEIAKQYEKFESVVYKALKTPEVGK